MIIKELSIIIRPSIMIKGHYTVDIKIIADGIEKTINEYLPVDDFESKFETMLKLAKEEILLAFKNYEEDYETS